MEINRNQIMTYHVGFVHGYPITLVWCGDDDYCFDTMNGSHRGFTTFDTALDAAATYIKDNKGDFAQWK